jgi:F-type H+-transporting ATPase subunit epsilon
MLLEILTPDKKVFSEEIKLIQVPGTNGKFEVLKNHAPIVSTLENGKIKIIAMDGNKTFFNIQKGVIEVLKNKVIVLAEKIIE